MFVKKLQGQSIQRRANAVERLDEWAMQKEFAEAIRQMTGLYADLSAIIPVKGK